ncbi:MAG: tRNA pseudouridine(55) synthase TruB [Chloroflexi bacterium]|nr:tRNA pseudouridine(55) synthase TruB [Chloroflexota bacterium]
MSSPGDGVFNVDKPHGITSMEVVRQIKHLVSQRHVGHGGTLDPEATGVLPVCLGQATRLMEFLVDSDKEYLATIRLGITTDTYDAQGQVVAEHDSSEVTEEAVKTALVSFVGEIRQTPPMFSALRLKGRRLHELARAGIEVERPPRTVQVKRLEMLRWEPPQAVVSIQCSRGVYIRSMAHDVGQVLGCGAFLAQLRRIRTGPFHSDQAVPLASLKEALQNGSWERFIHPPDHVVLHMEGVALTAIEERQVRNGQAVPLRPHTHYAQHMEARRAYSSDGHFVALVRFNRKLRLWQPFKVFRLEVPSPYRPDKGLS